MECNFDNRYKNILRERRELFTPCPKTIPNSKFFKTLNFSPTCSSAHVECNFDNSWKNFGSRPKNFVQLPKTIEEAQFFGKFSPKLVPMDRWNESTLGNPMKIFKQKAENLRSLSKNEEGNKTWWEVFFPQNCSYGHFKGNLVKPVGTSSPEGRIHYGRRPISIKKSFFPSSLTGDWFFGLWECSLLTNPTKVPCKKGGNFSLKVGVW